MWFVFDLYLFFFCYFLFIVMTKKFVNIGLFMLYSYIFAIYSVNGKIRWMLYSENLRAMERITGTILWNWKVVYTNKVHDVPHIQSRDRWHCLVSSTTQLRTAGRHAGSIDQQMLVNRPISLRESYIARIIWSRKYTTPARPLQTFSTVWKPHHSSFLRPLRRYKIPRGTPSSGALNTRGWENWRFSCDFRRTSPFISETVRDRPMVTTER